MTWRREHRSPGQSDEQPDCCLVKGAAMKHLEDQARQRVNDAIQTGMRSQAVKRLLAESKPAASLAPQERPGKVSLQPGMRPGLISVLLGWIFGVAR